MNTPKKLRIMFGIFSAALSLTSFLLASTAEAKTITANVVAMDHSIMLNRLGAMIPNGMIFALREDVVPISGSALTPGNVRLRPDKRPRPLVLRMNVGDTLVVNFQNLLSPLAIGGQPSTRTASVRALDMQLARSIASDGSHVGRNPNSLVAPGGRATYSFTADREGGHLLYSGSTLGGNEVGTGAFALGLFGAVNVEPAGADYYRSQVTKDDLDLATVGTTALGQPILDYDAVYPPGHRLAGRPILKMLTASNQLVHGDLNAIITGPGRGNFNNVYREVSINAPLNSDDSPPRTRNEPFREFTVIFHDEINATQAFPLFTPDFPGGADAEGGVNQNPLSHTLASVRDAFPVNYGSGGIGAEIIANRLGVGPMYDCAECKYEEFFLTSWVVGDPAMIVDIPAGPGDAIGAEPVPGPKATKAFYPDDPSNVFHSYLNDHVKMRNIHVGKEHHMFHLHAHQWLHAPDDDSSSYLDVQGLGPGASYTYEIAYNGSGNRNLTAGDSIFHCHFYPHFAQGMWSLWRVHDVFEGGTQLDADGRPAQGSRALPDAEILAGTPIPAVVPLPARPMAPMPGASARIAYNAGLPTGQIEVVGDGNPGYPFFIPGLAGRRPPKPPMDTEHDGGLPRHIVTSGIADSEFYHAETRLSFDKTLHRIAARELPETGTILEQAAMTFHAQRFHPTFYPDGTPAGTAANDPTGFKTNGLPAQRGAPFADPCIDDSGGPVGNPRTIKAAAFQFDMIMNKVGWHFNQARTIAHNEDVAAIMNKQKAPEPFFFRANSDDCITFYHTNLVPNVYVADDYQVRTPTDIIGQHIHLVKFDVTSSDGSGNGWNYEDGTFSPQEVVERINAINQGGGLTSHDGATVRNDLAPVHHPDFGSLPEGLGAQTTVQRWYADPTTNNDGVDRTLGTVFTHDHFGPSTHQQAGLYAFLGVEPKDSTWRDPEDGTIFGARTDGGPTSFRADIITRDPDDSFREFFMFTADFQPAYERGDTVDIVDPGPVLDQAGNVVATGVVVGKANPALVVNGPTREAAPLPIVVNRRDICPDGVNPPPCPEAIMQSDPGTMVVNYRNEPIAHRLYDPNTRAQAEGIAGDPAFAFRSDVTRAIPDLNVQPDFFSGDFLTGGMRPGDPFTPLLRAYYGDKIVIRLGTGAHEESHNASIHGLRWLQDAFSPNSGYINHQHLGIAEHFEASIPLVPTENESRNTFPFTDFLYKLGAATDDLWNGTWGILRAYDREAEGVGLLPMPNASTSRTRISNRSDFNGACPRSARVRRFDVSAVAASDILPPLPGAAPGTPGSRGTLVYNKRTGANPDIPGPLHDPSAIMYVRTSDLDPETGKLRPGVPIEPLVLRAAAGECIQLTLRNRLPDVLEDPAGYNHWPFLIDGFNANQVKPSRHVGLHPQLVAYDVSLHDGTNVGLNPNRRNPESPSTATQTAAPGTSITYRWYAGTLTLRSRNRLVATPVEFGATNLIPADPMKHTNKGAIGALIIEPRNASWLEDTSTRTSATVVSPVSGTFREFVVLFQDDVNWLDALGRPIPPSVIEEDSEDSGNEGLNYRAEPPWFRLGFAPNATPEQMDAVDYSRLLSNSIVGGLDPETPVFTARAGQQVRFRVLKPGGHGRNHVFVLHGHGWQRMPYQFNSTVIGKNPLSEHKGSQEGHGPYAHWNVVLESAGGKNRIRGDYLLRDFSSPHFAGGMWGIMRVR